MMNRFGSAEIKTLAKPNGCRKLNLKRTIAYQRRRYFQYFIKQNVDRHKLPESFCTSAEDKNER